MYSVVETKLLGQAEASPSRDSMDSYVVTECDGPWQLKKILNARRSTMKRQVLRDELDSLRAEAEREVIDLAASLKSRHQPE